MAIFFTVDRRGDGALQLSINDNDSGYRLAGPKYDGTGKVLLRHEITERDREELLSYLRRRIAKAAGS